MKPIKLILIVCILTFVTLESTAQLMIGPKAGLNITTQFKSDFSVPKFDWAFGGALLIPITNKLSVQGEVLITQKGYREEYDGKELFEELTATYLEIPAMAKYSIIGVNWGYFFNGGVYWGYWSKGEYRYSSINGEDIFTREYDIQTEYDKDGYKDIRSDFGLVVEAGVTYDNLGSGVLALGLRYSHGLVATGDYQNPPADVVMKYNRVLALNLTYFLYL